MRSGGIPEVRPLIRPSSVESLQRPLFRHYVGGIALVLLLPVLPVHAQTVEVKPMDRLDLLGIVFRLAGNPEYNQCRVPRYNQAITTWFEPFREHPAVVQARSLRQSAGVGFSSVMSLGIHLGELPDLRERRSLSDTGLAIESRVGGESIRPFLELVRRFARDTRAVQFFRQNRLLLDTAGARLNRAIQTEADPGWFERFFGPAPNVRLVLVPGTCNGGANYGPRFLARDGSSEVYGVIGAEEVDSGGWPVFRPRSAVPLMVHEFNHSFVNPVMDAEWATLRSGAETIHRAVQETMRRQAYGPQAMINESVVRAAAARYVLAHLGAQAAQSAVGDEMARGFLWTQEVFDLLGRYEADRVRYPKLQAFVPELATYFQGLAIRVEGLVASWEARRPRLIEIRPANGDTAVSPELSWIVLRFDRPMGKGYSLNFGPGGQATFPEVLSEAFDSTGQVFSLEVRLQPARQYELAITGSGFRSAEGVPLATSLLRFRTRSP